MITRNNIKWEQASSKMLRFLPPRFLALGGCFFLVTAVSFAQAQRPDVSTIEKTFYQLPTPQTAVALSTAYQGLAQWFQKAPQFNRDSAIFYFEKAIETVEKMPSTSYESLTQMQFCLAEYYNSLHYYGQSDAYCAKAWASWQQIADPNRNKLLQYDILNTWSLTSVAQGQLTKGLD